MFSIPDYIRWTTTGTLHGFVGLSKNATISELADSLGRANFHVNLTVNKVEVLSELVIMELLLV